MYHYYKRGRVHYWNEDPLIVSEAHRQAVERAERGDWERPSDLAFTDRHPSFLGVHWRLSPGNF
jgi:hypothetical protein